MALVPLAFVAFTSPIEVEGCSARMLTVEPKVTRLPHGTEFTLPQPYLNEEARVIVISGREYPMERVHYYTRAKMAKSKNPVPADMSAWTIGKKA